MSFKKQLEDIEKRLKDLEAYVYNFDDYLPARSFLEKAIGYLEKKDTITDEELQKRFRIPLLRAQKLIELLIDYGLLSKEVDGIIRVVPDAAHQHVPPISITTGPDPLFDEALKTISTFEHASASVLQRRMKIGYARAARLLDELEEAGIVSPAEGSTPRKVLKR